MFSNFFCREICWNQNNSLILPVTHRKPICKGEWVIYWKGRLRNVILESSNLANLKPSPKVRQRERPQRVYYIPTYSEQPLLSSGYSLYLNYNTSRRGLSDNKKNNEMQSRRAFFKKAAKSVLPLLGIAALAATPTNTKAAETPQGCQWDCTYSCRGGCQGCTGSCRGGCSGRCLGSCTMSCTSCYSTCRGTCMGNCSFSSSF